MSVKYIPVERIEPELMIPMLPVGEEDGNTLVWCFHECKTHDPPKVVGIKKEGGNIKRYRIC